MNSRSYSRYRDMKSIVHSIDPLTKFVSFLIITVTIFIAQTPETLLIMFGSLIIIGFLSRIRISTMFKIILFVLPFTIVMFVLYALVSWDIESTAKSVSMMSLRLYVFILIAIIFTSTTKELEIARSIEWLIHPLRYIKVPTYEISMLITLAIRFIPVLINDLFMIMRAQTSRGMNVVNGKLSTRVKGVFGSLLPMFVISFRRADDLAIAMTVRKYTIGQKRTKYWKNRFGLLEIVSLLLVSALTTLILLMRMGII